MTRGFTLVRAAASAVARTKKADYWLRYVAPSISLVHKSLNKHSDDQISEMAKVADTVVVRIEQPWARMIWWRMDAVAKANRIFDLLSKAIPDTKPLLEYRSSFELLIAVILSAQTTDNQVNKVTRQLFQKFPDAATLGSASIKEIERIVKATGFYRNKAKYIVQTALIIENNYDGLVPDTMEQLDSLPGVGRKSANVILGTCFGKPAIIVDTHFSRVARRLGFTDSADPHKIEMELKMLVPEEKQYKFSMLINRHGRIWCYARIPECESCPIRMHCPHGQTIGAVDAKNR